MTQNMPPNKSQKSSEVRAKQTEALPYLEGRERERESEGGGGGERERERERGNQ
jgi:hypothetical protein